MRDDVAARVVAELRPEAKTLEQERPRRKRYTLPLDLNAELPSAAEREPNAPAALMVF